MKIGIVTTWFERGAAYVSKQYIEALKKDPTNEIFVYARGGESQAKGSQAWDKDFVTWGSSKWGKEASEQEKESFLLSFKNWIINNKLDVIIFNEEHWWEAVILASKLGVKIGSYIDYYTKETLKFYMLYDFLVCNTKRHYGAFRWHPQAYFVPWGTDTSLYKPIHFNLVENNKVTFFHSAGMNPERKGTDILIKAFYRLNQSNAKLIIHSQKPLKFFFPKLKEKIINLEKSGQLVCVEKTVSAPGLYYMGDVYVYPTILEGIGLTITEALSSGLPVITSDNAPMNEIVNDKVGKLIGIRRYYYRDDNYYWPLCEVDENKLVTSMRYFIDNSEMIPQMKKDVRKYAEENLDWVKNSSGLGRLIEEAKIIPSAEKNQVLERVLRYEAIKKSKVKRFFHKIAMLKFGFIPYGFRFVRKIIAG